MGGLLTYLVAPQRLLGIWLTVLQANFTMGLGFGWFYLMSSGIPTCLVEADSQKS